MTGARDRFLAFARHYLVAVQFFTRLPVTGALAGWVGWTPELMRASAAHFPGVGWIVGMVGCVAFAVIALALPDGAATPFAAAVGCTIATVLFTGGFHEDGLADVADGLGSGAGRQRALEIMKDSRVGAFGAMALMLALLAKTALLAVLATTSPGAILVTLFAGHVVSRFWPLVLMHTMAYVGDEAGSKSKPMAERIDRRGLRLGALWCVPPLAVMVLADGTAPAVLALLASGVALWMLRNWYARRLQGFTGDCLGAAQQVCEVAFYFGAAVGFR